LEHPHQTTVGIPRAATTHAVYMKLKIALTIVLSPAPPRPRMLLYEAEDSSYYIVLKLKICNYMKLKIAFAIILVYHNYDNIQANLVHLSRWIPK
jgi:hypothetical protein